MSDDWKEIEDYSQECSDHNGWCGMCGNCKDHADWLNQLDEWEEDE